VVVIGQGKPFNPVQVAGLRFDEIDHITHTAPPSRERRDRSAGILAGFGERKITPLDEVRALLQLGGPEKASCREVRKVAAHHLDDIRAKIADLRKQERRLSKTVTQCTGTTAPICSVLDILDLRRSM
jgi:hypothetical protein